MSRIIKSTLWLFFLSVFIAALSGTQVYAQQDYFLELKSDQSIYSLNAKTYILEDSQGKMTLQDLSAAYGADKLTYRNTNPDKLTLKNNEHPYWLIFTIKNRTARTDWYIDIGSLADGRAGVAKKFMVYEMLQRKIFYDGFQLGSKNNPAINNSRYIPVTVPADSKAVFMVYIQPTAYKSVNLNLSFTHIIPPTPMTVASVYADHVPALIYISVAFIVLGFMISRGIGFVPLTLYYIGILLWLTLVEKPFYNSFMGIGFLTLFFPVFNAFLITIAALLTVPSRYSNPSLRTILMASLGFTIGISILSSFVFPIEPQYQALFINASALLTLWIAIVYLINNDTYYIRPSALCLAGWIGLYILGQIAKIGCTLGYISANYYTAHAEYIVLLPQVALIFVGIILTIKSYHTRKLSAYVRQAQKTQALLQAKKAKEENDHARLLRVIEREREVMEELRSRESERTEEMRKAKIVADEANQAKSAFLAVVSHEIRTPMTGIMGMIRMLQDTDLSLEQKEYLMTIKDSGDAMLALLNDILDFSKIEGGGMTLENIEFDLRRVLNGVLMLMKGHADQKNVALRLNIHENVPSILYGDPTRLRQVILNLVGNALKFTSKGHVGINVFLDPTHEDNKNGDDRCAIYFSVEDTGIGISEEAQQNLFAPFSQADSSISRRYGGTGLGLSICRRLVEAMGGEINLKSREGSGSTFFFTLPFNVDVKNTSNKTVSYSSAAGIGMATTYPQEEEEQRTYTQAPVGGDRLRFLIVDDNEVNRKVVKSFLDKANYDSVIIYSGKEALNLLEKDKRFDGILLDIEMPDMNGRDVARTILKDRTIAFIPVIALTGNVSKADLRSYRDIGFKGYVAKPVTPENLLDVIAKITGGEASACFPRDLDEDKDTSPPKQQSKPQRPIEAETERTYMSGKTLDDKMVQGLKDGLGVKQTLELLEDLFAKTDEIMGNLRKAVAEDSMEKIRIRAHELKGMAGNFGLKAVSEKAAQLEQQSRKGELTMIDVETHLVDLSTLIERSKLAMDDFFRE